MLILRNVTRIRVFVLVNNISIFLSSSSLSSSSPSSSASSSDAHPFFFSSDRQHSINSSQSREVAVSFLEWFKSGKNALLDRIFSILSDRDEDDPSSRVAADLALSQLGLTLSEGFVLEVLDYGKDVLSCLKFFDWVGRQCGFLHTHATFHAIFKIMSRAKQMSLMVAFLDNYVKQMYVYRIRLYNVLVMGYAVAGRPDLALHLFGKMRFIGLDLDSFSYHVLLNALVEEERFYAVAVVIKQIFMRGLESKFTYSIMVKSLCKQNQLEEGEAFIRRLVSDGHAVSGIMVGQLVDALCRSQKFGKAGRLVEEFRKSGMVETERCYAVWIKNLVQGGKVDGALEFLQSKKALEGYAPDVFRYNMLICRLLRENQLEVVCDLLMEMTDRRIPPNNVTISSAFCFFCKAGMVDVALELFNSRSEFGFSPNSMAYNILIDSLCWDGSIDEAYSVFKDSINQGFFPGRKTFSVLADALCTVGKLHTMKELIVVALEQNFMPSASTYDKFISALCRAGMVGDGYLIHGELNRINQVSYRSTYLNLIHGLINSNRGDIAARLLMEMQEKGHTPTQRLFKAVIKCVCDMEHPEKLFFPFLDLHLSHYGHKCLVYNIFIDGAGYANKPELATEVFEMMGRSGVLPNLSSVMLMLQIYLQNDRISNALTFFEDLYNRKRVRRKLYHIMIVGLCEAKKPELALKILGQMKENNVTPSLHCYELLVKLLSSNEEYDKVVNLVDELEKLNRPVSSSIGNTLLLHSLKGAKLYQAWDRLICLQNTASHFRMLGRLIGGFSGCISLDLHTESLVEAIEQCFPVDINTYNLLLRRLTNSQMDLACDLFIRLCQKGYEPNQWTFKLLASGFFKQGKVAAANRCLEMSWKGFDPSERMREFT